MGDTGSCSPLGECTMMPSTLPQFFFDVLGVWNRGWTPFQVTNRLLVTGTGNGDEIKFDPFAAAVVNAGGGNDHITITGNLGLATTLNGGDGQDQIFGGNGNDLIDGGNGNDYIVGGAGLTDRLSGGAGILGGIDTLSYESSNAGVTVNMAVLNALGNITVSGGHANGDIVSNNFENVVGSEFNDTITGNAGNNILIGLGGDDTLNGSGGDDELYDGIGRDTLNGGAGNDTFQLEFVPGVTQLDVINGGADTDLVDYSLSSLQVNLSLLEGFASIDPGWFGGGRRGDTLNSIENVIGTGVIGSRYQIDDILEGSDTANVIHGGAGEDWIKGAGGNDTIYGGLDSDFLFGGLGADRFVYSSLDEGRMDVVTRYDYIEDFSKAQGDKIDLSQIDANTIATGHQGFQFIGNADFSNVAGQLRIDLGEGGNVFGISGVGSHFAILGDVDGNGTVDFTLQVNPVVGGITASEFIL